jgi:hypothetical protein
MSYHPQVRSLVRYLVLVLFACVPVIGCADSGHSGGEPTTRPMTMQERQDAAMRDPYGYGGNTDKYDMTGGDISHYDKKAMKRDLDSVFNP